MAVGDPEAINQYVGVVLGNSDLPAVKMYRYVAAPDEIRETPCPQKEQRERYNGAVAAVAVRTFHDVFESDREKRVKTISLTVQTEAVNPATGLGETYRFVAAAADRDELFRFNLANVDPAETLAHMRSSVSKNAFGLKPISAARGVK